MENVDLKTDPTKAAETATSVTEAESIGDGNIRKGAARFLLFGIVLSVVFYKPLAQLVAYALDKELYSHVLLMPFIAGYLIWIKRKEIPLASGASPALGGVAALVGFSAMTAFWVLESHGSFEVRTDQLFFTITAYLCFLFGGASFCFSSKTLASVTFPIFMLTFMVPFPAVVIHGIEMFLQHGSAEAASLFFKLSPTPVLRDGLVFELPGMSVQVAEECSGIRSTFVLFITSLIGGYLFLKNPWNRAWFVLITIPLGLLRNGFRVLTISLLCVYVDPKMIDSPIHHRGGPIFFALSLIPLFGFLVLLRKRELRRERRRKEGEGAV